MNKQGHFADYLRELEEIESKLRDVAYTLTGWEAETLFLSADRLARVKSDMDAELRRLIP